MEVLREHTAGDPQHPGVRWTNLRRREIARRMSEAAGVPISRQVVSQLLKKHGFVRRKAQKQRSRKYHPNRNKQFEHITQLKADYLAADQPVISIDTKKKELIGNFYRDGKLYATQTVEVLDHDFPSDGDGKVIPHGVYDIGLNKGHINLNTSCDTTEFACDSIAHWWAHHGRVDHPQATELLILCDGGGSNPSRSWLFKQDLQSLANKLGLKVRIAHYPPYCSKHNPIEHRLFPHITRACEGVVFHSVSLVKELIQKTQTRTGLKVTVDILDTVYQTGRKAAKNIHTQLNLTADAVLPQWNYILNPVPA